MKIAVQLYSLRDIIKGSGENLLAILPRVKELGYDGVELTRRHCARRSTPPGSSPSVRTSPLRATRPKTLTRLRSFAALSA